MSMIYILIDIRGSSHGYGKYYLEFPDQNPENFDENGNLKEEVAVEIALERFFLS
ncbi:hypothetical protein [Acinetobacter oleivorans]|uniref:hypothetical protein n=1 Tax=Acinetobacter oleivorans TaxID=1148157 RepID=UPI001580E615|nr:hypothetical protein [Acinetobacter oleivorans]NUG02408.1 hypothetical protein [Acinetobacter oleivorans]